jgi:hypothetical protein
MGGRLWVIIHVSDQYITTIILTMQINHNYIWRPFAGQYNGY